MAYDSSGRLYARRATGQSGYFDGSEDKPSFRRRTSSSARQQTPPVNDRINSDPLIYEGVSPELIAAITEKVKQEVVDHFKQTGSLEEPERPPPMQRIPSNRSSSTSSPPLTSRKVYTPPSPSGRYANLNSSHLGSKKSPPDSPGERSSSGRFPDRNLPTRPAGGRTYSTMELSTIDQKWGRLFDNDGKPTPRLGQFLRGLANHLIEEFQPQKSIVVVPAKLAAYYAKHALAKEVHPLVSMFGAQDNELISELYQELSCEHHFVQEHPSMAPTVPALTPVGFERWMTINIQAYPEQESKRFETVVLAMPIDADGAVVDGKPERLPKQISRHLLPEREDPRARKLLSTAISEFLNNSGKQSSRRKKSITSHPLSRHRSTSQSQSIPGDRISNSKPSNIPPKTQPLERERNPYAGNPSTSETANSDDTIKIERERQPYSAQPGNGKIHTDSGNESNHNRTESNSSTGYMPPPRRPRRPSSPPLKGFSHSTPDNINVGDRVPYEPPAGINGPPPYVGSSFSPSGSFPPPPPPMDIRDPRRARDDRSYRRAMEDEMGIGPELNSPRDAERWDRYQEIQAERPYERGTVPIDPSFNPSMRGAAYEDWYREQRGPTYDTFSRY